MASKRVVVRNVPNSRLSEVVFDLISQGAHVTTLPEPDGEWTVIGVFPPASTGDDTEHLNAPPQGSD